MPLLLTSSSVRIGLLSLCRAPPSEQCASSLHQHDDRWWASSDDVDKDAPTIQRYNLASAGSSTARNAYTASTDVRMPRTGLSTGLTW